MEPKIRKFIQDKTHKSWHAILTKALLKLEPEYLEFVLSGNYLPSQGRIFNAFKTLPKDDVKYILFGQDPYPREKSAIGYAFIDGAVSSIFNQNRLSKEVNRATSLRNFIKMALVANGLLNGENTGKDAIEKINKTGLINSIYELKDNFEKNGVLLLNAALVFENKKRSAYHIKKWKPFIKELLNSINPDIKLILFGNGAKAIKEDLNPPQESIEMEHPYNISFINSPAAHKLFKKMNLLQKQI